jgi:hypothetical protein
MSASGRRFHGDDGGSLILALAFLTMMSVITVSVLGLAMVSSRSTVSTRDRAGQLYAADGGVEWAVQKLTDANVCPTLDADFHGGVGTFDTQITGKTVTVQCKTTAVDQHTETVGGSTLLGGYAAILGNDNSGGLDLNGTQNQGPDFFFGGNVYSQGVVDVTSTQLGIGGNLELRAQECTPAGVVFPDGGQCSTGRPVPPDPLPAVKIPATALAPATVGSCTILYPGKYGSKPTFSSGKEYYLASGTYYFDGVGAMNLKGEVFGGAMGSTDQKLLPNTPCADDALAKSQPGRSSYNPVGTGVTIILGGNSDFRVQAGARVELFTRDAPESGTTAGVTLWARRDRVGVAPPTSAYNPRQPGEAAHLEHKNSDVLFHGLTYLPDLEVVLNKEPLNRAAGGASMFGGGLLAKLLTVNAEGNNGAQPAVVTLAGGITTRTYTTPRTTEVRVTATGTNGTNTVTAVIERTTDPPTIKSWRQG